MRIDVFVCGKATKPEIDKGPGGKNASNREKERGREGEVKKKRCSDNAVL